MLVRRIGILGGIVLSLNIFADMAALWGLYDFELAGIQVLELYPFSLTIRTFVHTKYPNPSAIA
jgi:hypothetical protein